MQATRLTEVNLNVTSAPGRMHRRSYLRRRRRRPRGSPSGPRVALPPAHKPVAPGAALVLTPAWCAPSKSAGNPFRTLAATPDLSESLCAATPSTRGLIPKLVSANNRDPRIAGQHRASADRALSPGASPRAAKPGPPKPASTPGRRQLQAALDSRPPSTPSRPQLQAASTPGQPQSRSWSASPSGLMLRCPFRPMG
jgi:hypothetical protein